MRFAAVDQGTTSTRCLVIEEAGKCTLAGSLRHAQHYPLPGWVEHDAEEILANIQELLTRAGSVDAIGLANQGESCLAWDAKTGEALSPLIVWQDARTASRLASFEASGEELSRRICGLPLDPYFSASKLAWLVEHNEKVATARASGRLRLGTSDAFFLDRLCGTFATDLATASRTGLLDLERGDWSAELCEMHRVPREFLPEIRPVNGGFGTFKGTPVSVSVVDQQGALYGHGCRKPGDCKITFGTGAFLLAVTGTQRPVSADLLPTVAWQKSGEEPTFALEGGVYDAGSALEWARSIGLWSEPGDLDGFSGPSALSRGLVFVPSLSGLAAPFWDRRAAPLFIGMDHATDRRDLLRAVLEGIAMLTVTLINSAACATSLGPELSIDGGLSRSAFFGQFLASACNRVINVPQMHELTALGLAELGSMDTQELRRPIRIHRSDACVSDADHQRFAEAVRRAREWR